MSNAPMGPGGWPPDDGRPIPPGQQFAPPPQVFVAAAPRNSGTATMALVFAILGWVCFPCLGPCLALVLGISAKREIAKSGGMIQGTGMATAAIVIALLQLGAAIIILIIVVIGVATTPSSHVSKVGMLAFSFG